MKWLKRIYAVLALCWVAYCLLFVDAITHGTWFRRHDAFVLRGIIVPCLGYVFFFSFVPGIIAGFRNKR